MREFIKKVEKEIIERLSDEKQVRIQEVQKNNGVILQGLVILSPKQSISPTIYLNAFYEAYEAGVALSVIVDKILCIYEEDVPKQDVDINFFKEFEQVKERICYKLISTEKNRELLDKIPHMDFLDLSICFYYAYQGDDLGMGSILIYNTHLEMWNTDTEELWKLAGENTPRLFPRECCSMEDIIREMMFQQREDGIETILDEAEEEQFFGEMPMLILSNTQRVFGAACILYPGLLAESAKKAGCNLYLIPSSIHEVILLPDTGTENPESLREMVAEANSTQVEPEEVLSDRLYYYDMTTGKVTIAP